ncbi:hypothetical protein BJF83_22750 [Nocardiopsis sp. CNR-923]|nr:hypothetical protein BJF83_22750 [Nocardiopsis sp. CNR-923]
MNLSTRFPLDDLAFVKEMITSLRQQSVLPDRDFSTSGYSDWERLVASSYDHGGNMTYIFPEEALLIHALASVINLGMRFSLVPTTDSGRSGRCGRSSPQAVRSP